MLCAFITQEQLVASGERERVLQRQLMAAEMRLEEAQEAQVHVCACVYVCVRTRAKRRCSCRQVESLH